MVGFTNGITVDTIEQNESQGGRFIKTENLFVILALNHGEHLSYPNVRTVIHYRHDGRNQVILSTTTIDDIRQQLSGLEPTNAPKHFKLIRLEKTSLKSHNTIAFYKKIDSELFINDPIEHILVNEATVRANVSENPEQLKITTIWFDSFNPILSNGFETLGFDNIKQVMDMINTI